MTKHRQKMGRRGEDLAVRFLTQNQYKVLERNWRYSRSEIDIIASIDDILVFIEVKTRRSDVFASPEESVDQAKQRKIVDAANRYMDLHQYEDEIRFDIISIVMHSDYSYTIKHFEDAFFPGMGH